MEEASEPYDLIVQLGPLRDNPLGAQDLLQGNPEALRLFLGRVERYDVSPADASPPVGPERDRWHQACSEVLQCHEGSDELRAAEIAAAALQALDQDPCRHQRGNLCRQVPLRNSVSSLQGMELLQSIR
jgi:hypothetical protein